MTRSALDSATDLTATVVADPRRARRQIVVIAVASALFLVAAVLLVPLALRTPGLWVLIGILGLLVAFGAFVVVVLRLQAGTRVVGFSPRGVFVPIFADPVGWNEIAMLSAVRYPNRSRGVGLGGVLATRAMSSGGVNDGGRDLLVVLKDPAAVKARIGKDLEFLVSDSLPWEEKGTPGVQVALSNPTDDAGFQAFVLALKAEADARGIPITISTR